jgi:hypothetical protein
MPRRNRLRIVLATGLAAVATTVIVATWLGGADWRRLLLFAGVVGVAAWGGGHAARVPSQQVTTEDAPADAAAVGEEHPAP